MAEPPQKKQKISKSFADTGVRVELIPFPESNFAKLAYCRPQCQKLWAWLADCLVSQKEEEILAAQNKEDFSPKPCVIRGPPGTGKSTVVWQWCKEQSANVKVNWISVAGNRPNLKINAFSLFQNSEENQIHRDWIFLDKLDSSVKILVLDGVTDSNWPMEEMKDLLVKRTYLSVFMVSSVFVKFKDNMKSKKFPMYGWTKEEYEKAVEDPVFAKSVYPKFVTPPAKAFTELGLTFSIPSSGYDPLIFKFQRELRTHLLENQSLIELVDFLTTHLQLTDEELTNSKKDLTGNKLIELLENRSYFRSIEKVCNAFQEWSNDFKSKNINNISTLVKLFDWFAKWDCANPSDDDIHKFVKASIDWKYHYAGASARYMFDFHIEECVFAISEAVNYCGNYKEIFQGVIPESTNCLRTTFCFGIEENHAISSEFASRLLSKNCTDEFIKSALIFALKLHNQSFQRWVFAMKFRNQLKVRDFKGTTIQLITRKLNQQGNFEQASAIQWVSREVVSFGDINKDKVELYKKQDDLWLVPLNYCQGGYDSLYLHEGKLTVIQNSVALSHPIKWWYVQEAIFALKYIHKYNVTEVEYCFVVPIGNLLTFDLDKCKSEDSTAFKLFMNMKTSDNLTKFVYGLP